MIRRLILPAALLASGVLQADPVKVYVLAGQSNMEGKVQKKLMGFQATDSKTRDLFKHLRKDDDWIVRDDVMIKYLGEHGGLTEGYGSRDRTGVELEFGWIAVGGKVAGGIDQGARAHQEEQREA